jgi:hypothetical protein
MFRYADDVLSLSNSSFGELIDRFYPIEFEIKDTTYTDRSASYFDLHLERLWGAVQNDTSIFLL